MAAITFLMACLCFGAKAAQEVEPASATAMDTNLRGSSAISTDDDLHALVRLEDGHPHARFPRFFHRPSVSLVALSKTEQREEEQAGAIESAIDSAAAAMQEFGQAKDAEKKARENTTTKQDAAKVLEGKLRAAQEEVRQAKATEDQVKERVDEAETGLAKAQAMLKLARAAEAANSDEVDEEEWATKQDMAAESEDVLSDWLAADKNNVIVKFRNSDDKDLKVYKVSQGKEKFVAKAPAGKFTNVRASHAEILRFKQKKTVVKEMAVDKDEGRIQPTFIEP